MKEIEELKEFIEEGRVQRDQADRIGNLIKSNLGSFSKEIFEEGNAKTLVLLSQVMGRYLKEKGVTSSQIRNIFGYVKRIDMGIDSKSTALDASTLKKLYLLSPKLAYVIGRNGRNVGTALTVLKELFDKSIEKVGNNKEKFKTFMDLFESILSYHKFYGGK